MKPKPLVLTPAQVEQFQVDGVRRLHKNPSTPASVSSDRSDRDVATVDGMRLHKNPSAV